MLVIGLGCVATMPRLAPVHLTTATLGAAAVLVARGRWVIAPGLAASLAALVQLSLRAVLAIFMFLGLASIAHRVDTHRQSARLLRLRSAPGEGSRFTVLLPAHAP